MRLAGLQVTYSQNGTLCQNIDPLLLQQANQLFYSLATDIAPNATLAFPANVTNCTTALNSTGKNPINRSLLIVYRYRE